MPRHADRDTPAIHWTRLRVGLARWTADMTALLTALGTYANGKPSHFRLLSDILETEGAVLDMLASLGLDATRGPK